MNCKIIFNLIVLGTLMIKPVNAQDKEGAIKTKEGYILYFNYENPFTLNLIGIIDLSNYPSININGNLLDFNYGVSDYFKKEDNNILINYMNWEKGYLSEAHKKSIETFNKFIMINKIQVNLWYYINPALINDNNWNKKQFYADFNKDKRVYRLSLMLFKGSDREAEEFLINIIKSFKFCNEKIDIFKLAKSNIER